MVDEISNIKTFPGSGSTPPSRTMPNNLQAEQNLLGAILLDNSVLERIDDRLLADHFYDPFHGRIFSTMQRLVERGQLANPVTLKSFFTDSDDFQSDSAESYLSELADGVNAQARRRARRIESSRLALPCRERLSCSGGRGWDSRRRGHSRGGHCARDLIMNIMIRSPGCLAGSGGGRGAAPATAAAAMEGDSLARPGLPRGGTQKRHIIPLPRRWE